MRVSVRRDQVEFDDDESKGERERGGREERRLKVGCNKLTNWINRAHVLFAVKRILPFVALLLFPPIAGFLHVRLSTLIAKGSIHTCPGLLDLRHAQPETANLRHVHFATLDANCARFLGQPEGGARGVKNLNCGSQLTSHSNCVTLFRLAARHAIKAWLCRMTG